VVGRPRSLLDRNGRYDSKTRGFAFLLKSDVYVMDKRVVEISEKE
jgi:hypothetical protein